MEKEQTLIRIGIRKVCLSGATCLSTYCYKCDSATTIQLRTTTVQKGHKTNQQEHNICLKGHQRDIMNFLGGENAIFLA